MKAKSIVTVIACTAVLTSLFIAAAWSQDDIEVLSSDAFVQSERAPAVFKHDEHNEIADIMECNVCHHVYEDGKFIEDDDSVGYACADCHTIEAQGSQPGLRLAYHKQCKSCHVDKGKGPLACGQCHPAK